MYGTLENQDGIDLRCGCEYITIENITGCTGDDVVALTALPESNWILNSYVEGKSVDIHDITIRNIMASAHGCSLIRFLCEDGAREYNITVTDVKDTSVSISGCGILFGTSQTLNAPGESFARKTARKMGDFQNVVVRNLTTRAQNAILLAEPMKDVLIENIATYGNNEVGIQMIKNFEADNVVIRNFNFRSSPETAKAVFYFYPENFDNLRDFEIQRVRADKAQYVFCGKEYPITDFEYDEPIAGYIHPEPYRLASAYGRYHRQAYGKIIENRPADNRFNDKKQSPIGKDDN